MKQATKLILMRHGQSMWNLLNLFTGWVDVPLSSQGIEEALAGGKKIANEPIDHIFTSTLIRAQMTAMLAMTHHHSKKVPVMMTEQQANHRSWPKIHHHGRLSEVIPVTTAWQLNERMYGELQGMNKAEAASIFGKEQIQQWRRSYDIAPPEGESLKMTAARTLAYFEQTITPLITQGKNIFIAAHGNSLRSIIMELDGLSETEVVKLELKTGDPIYYSYQSNKFKRC